MKVVIVVADGMADWRYPELGDRSPVEYACSPGMDEIVRRGRVGLVQAMYQDLPLGTLTGVLGILGYRPPEHYPLGRSIFEARGLGARISPEDVVFRCNIVRVGHDGVLEDFTAGQISDAAAHSYLAQLNMENGWEILHDLSYRNVLICRDCSLDERQLLLHEPHENVGSRIEEILPRYRGELYQPFVHMMKHSRRDGLMLWPWGASRILKLPPLPYRMVAVSALNFLRGMAEAAGGRGIIPPGATGYVGSDLGAKLAAAVRHLPEVDVCLIHCNAPDEEGHARRPEGKVRAIEEIDSQVVVPLLDHLDGMAEPYRLWLLPDHYTVCGTGRHLADAVPCAVCGDGIAPNHPLRGYSEVEIAGVSRCGPAEESCRFLPALLRG